MKKFIYFLGMAAIVAGCQEAQMENVPELVSGETFKLEALIPGTKTAFTPPTSVKWETGDKLAVVVQASGYETTLHEFTKSSTGDNTFECEGLTLPTDGGSALHLIYPYSDDVNLNYDSKWTTPITIGSAADGVQRQDGVGTGIQSHIKAPLAGWYIVPSTPEATPSVNMHHITTLLDISFTNNSGNQVTVSKVTVTANEPLIGTFNIGTYDSRNSDGQGITAVEGSTSTSAVLEVSSGTVASGSSGNFYLITAPFSVSAEEKLIVTITTSENQEYTKTINVYKSSEFKIGTVNHISMTTESTEINIGTPITHPEITLTEDMLSSPYTVVSYPNDGAGLSALVSDSDTDYWHSEYSGASSHLKVDLDQTYGHFIDISLTNPINVFNFVYQTRPNNNNGVPKHIVIGGTNDESALDTPSQNANGAWTVLKEYTSDLATDKDEWCTLSEISAATAYKYLRFGIAVAGNNNDCRTGEYAFTALGGLKLYGENTTTAE